MCVRYVYIYIYSFLVEAWGSPEIDWCPDMCTIDSAPKREIGKVGKCQGLWKTAQHQLCRPSCHKQW